MSESITTTTTTLPTYKALALAGVRSDVDDAIVNVARCLDEALAGCAHPSWLNRVAVKLDTTRDADTDASNYIVACALKSLGVSWAVTPGRGTVSVDVDSRRVVRRVHEAREWAERVFCAPETLALVTLFDASERADEATIVATFGDERVTIKGGAVHWPTTITVEVPGDDPDPLEFAACKVAAAAVAYFGDAVVAEGEGSGSLMIVAGCSDELRWYFNEMIY
jgi:hypothetical protein